MKISGDMSIRKGNLEFLGGSRILLLEKIAECGSINRAAKAAGISYKTAWEQVDALNNLADRPLVVRVSGGRGGGGTKLTEAGREVVRHYRALQQEHERFLASLDRVLESGSDVFQMLRRIGMQVSARNLWTGKILDVAPGAVNAVVTLELKGGERIVAMVTKESVEALGLASGTEAFAMVKATFVVIARELGNFRLSARNVLRGRVVRLAEGAVNSEVTLELAGGNTVSATITSESVKNLNLRKGDEACAIIKSSSIIVGIP